MSRKSSPVEMERYLFLCCGGASSEVATHRCCAGVALVVKLRLRSVIPGTAALVAGWRKKEVTVTEGAIIGCGFVNKAEINALFI